MKYLRNTVNHYIQCCILQAYLWY